MTNHYEILGVSESATQDEIKNAYRSLVKKYHPDLNHGNSDTEVQFKKVQEAYDNLSDESKRKNYDFMRKNGYDPRGFNPRDPASYYTNNADPFADFIRQAQSQQHQANMSGQDIGFELSCSFEETIEGTKKNITFQINEACKSCNGEGLKKGATKSTCNRCKGHGKVSEIRNFGNMGTVQSVTICPSCGGIGQNVKPEDICKDCDQGLSGKNISIDVDIPAGVWYGQNIKLKNYGLYRSSKGKQGDCYIKIVPAKHDIFEINLFNHDIILNLYISLADAILGGKVEIPTIDGSIESLVVPPSTNHGSKLVIPKKGLYKKDKSRTDMIINIHVETMNKTEEVEKIVKKLRSLENADTLPRTEALKQKLLKYAKKDKKNGTTT